MSVTFDKIEELMEAYAPKALARGWDNVGLLVGSYQKDIQKVLVTLDVTDEVIEEAMQSHADLIVSHHPVIFHPMKSVTDGTALGRRVMKLIQSNIAVYASHSNLDIADGGTNDVLFDILALTNKDHLEAPDANGFSLGRVGVLPQEMSLEAFSHFVRTQLKLSHIRFVGNPQRMVKRVGLCTGSAADIPYFALAAQKKCHVYVTADVTHHMAQSALDLDLAIVDGTHYGTECMVVEKICQRLAKAAEEKNYDITIVPSQMNTEPCTIQP